MALPKIHVSRNALIITACLVLVFVAGIYTHKVWNTEVVKEQVAAAKAKANADYKAYRQAEAVKAEKAVLKDKCDKEVVAYNALPLAQKKLKEQPVCVQLLAD